MTLNWPAGAARWMGLLGILAAGALVFAIAPLSRVADRLAEKVVPLAAAGFEGRVPEAAGSRERVYRDAVRYAPRDGLTGREEAHLAALAQELGLGAADALRLRHEVEDDPSRGPA